MNNHIVVARAGGIDYVLTGFDPQYNLFRWTSQDTLNGRKTKRTHTKLNTSHWHAGSGRMFPDNDSKLTPLLMSEYDAVRLARRANNNGFGDFVTVEQLEMA